MLGKRKGRENRDTTPATASIQSFPQSLIRGFVSPNYTTTYLNNEQGRERDGHGVFEHLLG